MDPTVCDVNHVSEEQRMGEVIVQPDTDVVVVGYGPAGMAVAELLGAAGHRVVVLERYEGLYNLPRAATFDDETMRTLAKMGLAEALLPKLRVQPNYEWRNGQGELLTEHAYAAVGRSGWAEWYMMYQPDLEDALDRACRASANVQVCFGAPVEGIEQSADAVTLTVGGTGVDGSSTVTARYVVACDGGNSLVRRAMGVGQDDYGFAEPWMVCDFRFRRLTDVPMALQLCDPKQPTSIISLGPDHHRVSFMLDSEADFEIQRDPELVWARVAKYLHPDDAELIRVATYTFRSLIAHRWRIGRTVLAGDAAHQMPPFLGQGMCSGIRDAQNLAFKLDLILRGAQGQDILDTYQLEREPHVRAVTEMGVKLGQVQTTRDPERAAQRDRELLARRAAATAPEKLRFPDLEEGLLAQQSRPGRGQLSVQGTVDDGAGVDRLDQVVGAGFCVLMEAELLPHLAVHQMQALRRAGVRVVVLGDNPWYHPDADVVTDVDGTYRKWFSEQGWSAVVVRPDFYVFGAADGAPELRVLLTELLDIVGDRLEDGTANACDRYVTSAAD